jgi:hypothetical protein
VEQQRDHLPSDDGDNSAERSAARRLTPRHQNARSAGRPSTSHHRYRDPKRLDSLDPVVATDMPDRLPAIRGEVMLWRSFLADEINVILRDEK